MLVLLRPLLQPAAAVSFIHSDADAQPDLTPFAKHHRLAPEGIFYLVQYVYTKTDSGGIGYLPGTRVRLVEAKGDVMVVTAEGRNFNVASDKLTNPEDYQHLPRAWL